MCLRWRKSIHLVNIITYGLQKKIYITYPDACCTKSCYMVEDIKSNQKNDTKTQSKLTGARSEKLEECCHFVLLFTKPLQTLKKSGVKNH